MISAYIKSNKTIATLRCFRNRHVEKCRKIYCVKPYKYIYQKISVPKQNTKFYLTESKQK